MTEGCAAFCLIQGTASWPISRALAATSPRKAVSGSPTANRRMSKVDGRGDRAPPGHLPEQPGVERVGQAAEDGAQDKGDQEALDHVEKDPRDGDREEEEEAASVELLVADHGGQS